MQLLKKILLVGVVMILLSTTAAPALASAHAPANAEVNLLIRNKTETTVNLILRGPTDFTLTITRLTTTVKAEPGLYSYRYFACGHNNTGTFTLTGAGGTLLLRKCEKGRNSTVTIENRTGHTFALDMYGPQHYALILKPGDTKLTFVAGVYQYSTNACGFPIQKGTVKFKSGLNEDWIIDCD